MNPHSHDDRVRLKAYEIWLQEGQPEGRDQYHWAMAREAIGREDAYFSTLKPTVGEEVQPAEATPPVMTGVAPTTQAAPKAPSAKKTKAA